MNELALGTMARADKGPVAPPPVLNEPLQTVADEVAGWPGILTTAHWDLFDMSRVDGVDFYYGELELGHIHLNGWVHIATNPDLGRALVNEGLCRPFPYQQGWVTRGYSASVRAPQSPCSVETTSGYWAQRNSEPANPAYLRQNVCLCCHSR